MARRREDFTGPLSAWRGRLESWLEEAGCSPGRAGRAVNAAGRLSSWMAVRGLGLADLSEAVIDEHLLAERERSGAAHSAAVQYLPLVRRFLAAEGVLVLRSPACRSLGGVPRLSAGPLAGVMAELVRWLAVQGYSRGTALSVAGTAARLGAWMGRRRLVLADLDDGLLDRFVASQSRGPDRHPSSRRRIVTVRKFLVSKGLLMTSCEPEPTARSVVDECLDAWNGLAAEERSAGRGWLAERSRWARGFLELMTGPDAVIAWERVDARSVNEYVAAAGQGYSLSSRRHLASAMRSLLTWAFRTGRVTRMMVAGVLAPPSPRAGLPRALSAGQVEAIKTAADRSTALGRRDFAIVVMIVRLGLRVGEVAGLRLDDIDWHHGQVTVRGKGGRVLTLPLPEDVGSALVAHLGDGRPTAAAGRAVFLRVRPPLRGLAAKGISAVVARLARSAGLGTVHAHRLRHTAATAVLAGGGSLVEARELLGHARTDTTMVYARTDLTALRTLTVAWGRVPS